MKLQSRWYYFGSAAFLGLAGCVAMPTVVDEDARRSMLALLMPSRIEIVEPFTRVTSFNQTTTPDGIEVLLQAVNSLDNPGLMIAGDIRIELYEYLAASADPKGRRLEHWNVELSTAKQQREHWNHVTQMYEFRLRVDTAVIPDAKQYVLAVTYNSPLGDHLMDTCTIGYRPTTRPFGERRTGRRW